ncbi:YggT family protein [Cellvibrio japonicus]|uniref:YGGT family protein n=1 Tax=Cellvibrio japonicus (strain Ueda107) TaxID=498211 RepID=B3PFH4_CELJU|nr:YggT family protein [Cellvibrio japonicus]ACE83098.1 YGGT family protein [Cellvibrio japonicus Ueda107]QEI10843.1 YggT family protein [Cellvibrio japonicus]QEI14419.1 YggT family protein [Cellvibrio japonicus]QEI17997.1 YggT family protein [Cellvibrio japonicus]
MQTLAEIAIYLVRTIGSIYLMIVLLRFLLQLVRADYYNPISRFIVKATNPLLVPLRKIVPGFWGIDFACLMLALLVQIIILQAIILIAGAGWQNPLLLLPWSVVGILGLLASVYFWALLIMVIASWIAPYSDNPGLSLLRQLIEPSLAPIRKILPNMGGLDFSPMVALMLLHIFNQYIMPSLANAMGVPGGLL